MAPPTDSSEPRPAERHYGLFASRRFIIALVALVLFVAILLAVSTASRKEKLTWLEGNTLSRAMQPSPYTRLKFKLVRLTAPLWRWHRPRRPNVKVNARLVEITPGGPAAPILLGSATATNADGTRAWILSAEDFSALKSKIAGGGTPAITETSITVYNGGPARATMGPASMYGVANPVPVGLTIDVVPSLAAHSIRIILSSTYTKLTNPGAANFRVTTNFAAACRALIPNGGGLILENANTNTAAGTKYLFLVSPTAVNDRGDPLKL